MPPPLTPRPADNRCELEAAVRSKYRRAAADPRGLFAYPIGREGAQRWGYDAQALATVPPAALDRFLGVGNPFAVRTPAAGESVLDIGCGTGTDAFVAASFVGPAGRVAGIDLTLEMIAIARAAAAGRAQVHFAVASAEDLPFADRSFDQVLGNGALNLVVDKDRAMAEIARVLKPGGTLALADLLVVEDVPPSVLASMDAWST